MARRRKIAYGQPAQGLVEYAVILVLVAIVVMVVLALLGPNIGNIFSNVTRGLQRVPSAGGSGGTSVAVIVSVTASRTGGGQGNSVRVDVVVATSTTLTIADSQSGTSQTTTCNGSCSVTIGSVGNNAGLITVTAAGGGTATANYPARN